MRCFPIWCQTTFLTCQIEYRSQEKSTQRGTLRMEKELVREKDKRQKLLAIFRGRYLRYEMKSKEVSEQARESRLSICATTHSHLKQHK